MAPDKLAEFAIEDDAAARRIARLRARSRRAHVDGKRVAASASLFGRSS